MSQQEAVRAIIETIPLEVRTSARVAVVTDGVMEALRRLAPQVIYELVAANGPAEPERRLQLLEGRRLRTI